MKIRLQDAGSKKIAVIKEVRALTGLDLKAAKRLVDGAPCDIPCRTAQQAVDGVQALREAGATVAHSLTPGAIEGLAAVALMEEAQVALSAGRYEDARRIVARLYGILGC